ncbi:MAG TPA: DUF1801 domain-containing protein [Steroidobacteraceae bacterium]|nr:DUF1801 domain-containing protein [Steroidobacteraceae bacterium]
MAKTKTQVTAVAPKDFIAGLGNATRRADALVLLKLFSRITGWKARMWGPSIVGFGARHYRFASGAIGSICATGFSPRTGALVLYCGEAPQTAALLKKLGKHKGGIRQCLYINKLADVDLKVLELIVRAGLEHTKKTQSVTAS